MRCPVCFDELLPQRTAAGERLSSFAGPRFVVSAPCPACGIRLFGWTERDTEVPEQLVPPAGFLRWRAASRGWAVVTLSDVVTITLITSMSAVLVFFAASAVYQALLITSQTAGRAMFAAGPSLLLLGLVYLAASLLGPVLARSRAERDRAYRTPPGGLRLMHEPRTYRG